MLLNNKKETQTLINAMQCNASFPDAQLNKYVCEREHRFPFGLVTNVGEYDVASSFTALPRIRSRCLFVLHLVV